MEVRRIILKILLWSLAAAAVAGIAAVLIADNDIVERVMFTLLTAAICAGIALPTTFMLDREKSRPAGLFAMVFITAEFLVLLALVWADNTFLDSYEENLAFTFLGLLVTGLTSFGVLNLIRQGDLWKTPVRCALAACILAELCFAIAAWCNQSWRVEEDWWITGWFAGGFGIAAAVCTLKLGWQTWFRDWRCIGILMNLVAFAVGVVEIWNTVESWRLFSLAATSGVFVAFLNLLAAAPLKPGQGWVRLVTLASTFGGGVVINVLVFLDLDYRDAWYDTSMRLLAASGIATSCGVLAITVLLAINRRTQMERRLVDVDDVDITVVCPRCRRKQSLPAGESSCNHCGLRFDIRIEEPTCAECGYLLTRLTSDRCPECGTPIQKAEAPVPD